MVVLRARRSSSSGCFNSMLNNNNGSPRFSGKRQMTMPGPDLKVKTSRGHLTLFTISTLLCLHTIQSFVQTAPIVTNLHLPLFQVSPTKNCDCQAYYNPTSILISLPIARSGHLFGSLSISTAGFSATTATNSTPSSSLSIPPPSFLSRSASSSLNCSSRIPRLLSPVSLMSLVKMGVIGVEPADTGPGSGLTRGYHVAIPTKI